MIRSFKDKKPQLAAHVYVDETAVITGDVHLEEEVGIYAYATIRGDDECVQIGARTNIQEHVVIHESIQQQTILGEGISVGHGAILHGCVIEDNVLIGMHATVLDGVVIQANSIVAAGSVCPPGKVYPPNSMIMGAPAKAVRELRPEEIAKIKENADHYVRMSRLYREDQHN